MALSTETDGFRIHGREVYWWRRKKPGTSLFSTVTFQRCSAIPVLLWENMCMVFNRNRSRAIVIKEIKELNDVPLITDAH